MITQLHLTAYFEKHYVFNNAYRIAKIPLSELKSQNQNLWLEMVETIKDSTTDFSIRL